MTRLVTRSASCRQRSSVWNSAGAFLFGELLALAFCPFSAMLCFGVPMLLAFKSAGRWTFSFPFGATLALRMAEIGLSLPEMINLRRVLKPQLIVVFVGVVALAIIVTGYLFNAIMREIRTIAEKKSLEKVSFWGSLMNLKKSIWILFALALLFSSGLSACSGVTPTRQTTTVIAPATGATRWVKDFAELPKGTASHVEVVYFHRTVRCEACLNAESYTRETLDKYFADQMKSGLISLQVLDMEKPENAALEQKFDAAGSALYLSVLIQGTEYLCPNPDIWFYTSNKYLFVDVLRKKLASLVGGS